MARPHGGGPPGCPPEYTHANAYLAAFAAGITPATVAPEPSEAFEDFGELFSELTKFAAVLVFGALLTPAFFTCTTWGEWAVAPISLLLVRPASVLVSLGRSGLSRRERYGRKSAVPTPSPAADTDRPADTDRD